MYLANDKNFDRTLEQFLSGAIPKDEYKVVVVPNKTVEMIDTTQVHAAAMANHHSKVKDRSELL